MYRMPFLVLNSSQSDNGMVLNRQDEGSVYSLAQWNRIKRLLGVLVKLQPLYKVSCTNCVCVYVCVWGFALSMHA